MVDLTTGQRWLLEHMQCGEKICYSQDGDCAWFVPSHIWISTKDIPDAELHNLRVRGLIASESIDDDEDYRFGPLTVITDAGCQAIAKKDASR